MKSISHFCLILVCSLYFSAANAASSVKYCFSAEVTEPNKNSKLKVGDVISGAYESDAVGNTIEEGSTFYPPKSISLDVPGLDLMNAVRGGAENTPDLRAGSVRVNNDLEVRMRDPANSYFSDRLGIGAAFSSTRNSSTVGLHIYLEDFEAKVFDNNSLPTGIIPLSEFEINRFWLSFEDSDICLHGTNEYGDDDNNCMLIAKLTSLYTAASCPTELSAVKSLKTFVYENAESEGTRITQNHRGQSTLSLGYEFTVLEDGIITGFEAAMNGTSTVDLMNLETNKLVVSTAITAQVTDVTKDDWGVVTIADFPVKQGERYRVILRKPKAFIQFFTTTRPVRSYINIESTVIGEISWQTGNEIWYSISDYTVDSKEYKVSGLIDIVMHVPAAE